MARWRERGLLGAAAVGLAGCNLGTPPVTYEAFDELTYGDAVDQVFPGDVDGDGDLDLVATGDYAFRVLINDGSGRFTPGQLGPWLARYTTREGSGLADLDGDDDLDIVEGRYHLLPDAELVVRVWRNDGTGRYGDQELLAPAGTRTSGGVAGTAELTGDDIADVYRAEDGTLDVWPGGPVLGLPSSVPLAGPAPRPADLTGDGIDDMVTVRGDDDDVNGLTVWLTTVEQQRPRFRRGVTVLVDEPDGTDPRPVPAFGDVDVDGDVDVVASTAGRLRTLLGNGAGGLAAPVDSPVADARPGPLALGDLDGDGTLDVVATDRTAPRAAYVLFGNGDGTFTDRHDLLLPEGTLPPSIPAAANLGGDARADVAVPTDRSVAVFLNALTGRTH